MPLSSTNIKANIEGNEINFSFVKRLGQGAFGRADLFQSTRQTVLKIASLNLENSHVLKLAKSEAKVMATLSHPNIVRIFNAWIDEKSQEIIMELEYCGGRDLRSAISNAVNTGTRFSMATLQNWTAQLALGLGYIHDMGIVHRDIKPENVLLSTDEATLKISDFGISKIITTVNSTIGGIIGTVTYMAPEAFDDEPTMRNLSDDERVALFHVKSKLDVWAIGVLIYELALLELPYKPRPTQSAVIDMVLLFQRRAEPARIGDLEKLYSKALRQLIEKKLLVYDPKERAAMEQVLQDDFMIDEVRRLQEDSKHYVQEHVKLHRRQAAKSLAKVAELEEQLEQAEVRLAVLKADYQKTIQETQEDLRNALARNITLERELKDSQLKNQNEAQQAQHEVKIVQPEAPQKVQLVIIGDAAVGKSCLLEQLQNKRFKVDTWMTIGINLTRHKITIGEQRIELKIFDTSGVPRSRDNMLSYCRNEDGFLGVLLVYDITARSSFNSLTQWLEGLRQHALANPPIALIGNKCDLDTKRQVKEDEGEAFAREHGLIFMETSAKSAHNVEQAFMNIAKEILKKTH